MRIANQIAKTNVDVFLDIYNIHGRITSIIINNVIVIYKYCHYDKLTISRMLQ